MLFEKPSLRTRMTFELAIQQLGGFALLNEGRIGMREPLKDMARQPRPLGERHCGPHLFSENGGRSRPLVEGPGGQRSQRHLPSLPGPGRHADHPRALWRHPRHQARIRGRRQHHGELSDVERRAPRHGFRPGHSEKYEANPAIVAEAREIAARSRTRIIVTHDPAEAARGADAIYTDVWASMGAEKRSRRAPAPIFRIIRWTKICSRTPPPTPFSCTVCRPSAAKK